jgi:hypothetical protein
MGFCNALSTSAVAFGAPGCSLGSIVPRRFRAGTLTHTWVFP